MNWGSPAEFWAMGGYGLYVWGSFGVCAAAFAIEVLLLRMRRSAALRGLKRQVVAHRIEQEQPA